MKDEALKIAVKRREAKSKGEKERYKHLNAELQRIARRDKKAFFSDQCKMPGWMRHKLKSRFLGEISIISDMQMTSPLWQKAKN